MAREDNNTNNTHKLTCGWGRVSFPQKHMCRKITQGLQTIARKTSKQLKYIYIYRRQSTAGRYGASGGESPLCVTKGWGKRYNRCCERRFEVKAKKPQKTRGPSLHAVVRNKEVKRKSIIRWRKKEKKCSAVCIPAIGCGCGRPSCRGAYVGRRTVASSPTCGRSWGAGSSPRTRTGCCGRPPCLPSCGRRSTRPACRRSHRLGTSCSPRPVHVFVSETTTTAAAFVVLLVSVPTFVILSR